MNPRIGVHRGSTQFLLLLGVLVIASLVALAWWLGRDIPEEPEPVAPVTDDLREPEPIELEPLPEPSEDISSQYQLEGELPLLSQSDEPLKSHLRLLAGSLPVSWISGDQVLQKTVLEIDNIADGDLVYQHSPVVAPSGSFAVLPTGEEDVFLLDPSSYRRYDLYADFLAEQDSELMVAFYRYYEPLLDEAYIKLGNEPGAFRARFVEALERILSAPIIEGEIRLVRPLLSYEFEDEQLESLSMVEKQLIRMGPENTRKVQSALRPMLTVLRGD